MPNPASVATEIITHSGMNISWTTVLVVVLNILVGSVLGALIKNRPLIRKITADREANLLSERAKAMSDMQFRIEKLEAERTADHHIIGNLSQCLNALLMLLRVAPSDVPAHVATVETMRREQKIGEDAERAAIMNLRVDRANDPA